MALRIPMDPISRAQLERLLGERGLCLSIYAPMHRSARETKQNPIRFRNLMTRAEETLAAMGVAPNERGQLLEPLHKLAKLEEFWQHQDSGLALFRSQKLVRTFRLPLELEELVVVEDRFHIKPLLALTERNERFYLLELHVHQVRLFEADRFELREIDLGDAPRSLEEAVGSDVAEQALQYHSDRSAPDRAHLRGDFGRGVRHGGFARPVYHSQGEGKDDVKAEVRQWLTMLRDSVDARISDRQAPVVPVGSAALFPLFREVSALNVLDEGVHGSGEAHVERRIHADALAVARRFFEREIERVPENLPILERQGLASRDLGEVVKAAADGRVRMLLVSRADHAWGRYDSQRRAIERFDAQRPGADDLLDLAAVYTYEKGGKVWVLDAERIPDKSPIAAIYRYRAA